MKPRHGQQVNEKFGIQAALKETIFLAKTLSKGEVLIVVNRYIGVSGGYLGDFSYRTHEEFYPEFCGLEIDPGEFTGTTRERFISILSSVTAHEQASILRGVLKKYPPEDEDRKKLLPEIEAMLARLEGAGPVGVTKPRITSAVVERALDDAEALLRSTGATSGVDRVHTALHGYFLAVCDDAGISYGNEPGLNELYKLLRAHHPKLAPGGPRAGDITQLLKVLSSAIDVLNPLRNRVSVAHPNPQLLDPPEAWLVVNAARTLLHYFDTKLS